MVACNVGVEELGIEAFAVAFAFVEKGQKALTRLGLSAAATRMAAHTDMKNC